MNAEEHSPGILSNIYYSLRSIYIPTSPYKVLQSQKQLLSSFVRTQIEHKRYLLSNGDYINYIDINDNTDSNNEDNKKDSNKEDNNTDNNENQQQQKQQKQQEENNESKQNSSLQPIKKVSTREKNTQEESEIKVNDDYKLVDDDNYVDDSRGHVENGNNYDEMELVNQNELLENEEINEQHKHYHEIYQEEVEEEAEEDVEFAISEDLDDDIDFSDIEQLLLQCTNWNWNMNLKERQEAIFKFVTSVASCLRLLIFSVENYVDEARRLKAEANADILKKSSVIGGTVVGAAKRLISLRAAEPFAIIVEEACEVMEPTLVAVLAVESVKKLELVGDHRQLPAFVSQCWYNLELSMPSIKTSLFERIIMSEHQGHKPTQRNDNICSILDVQRRMRTSISNLTKSEYTDIVKIQDHECTHKQKVGDRISTNLALKKSWEFNGRLIPGISSCVYFWDLESNSESKPIAGLSACNENEAQSIVSLVKYLKLCGVNDECITIITPYTGQKRLIVRELKKEKCIPERDSNEKSIIISTVDRYQGDENDIVILSLVRTKPGNRFVGLANRFIVAASRARLGFYIVGSLSAVLHDNQGASHWKRFVEQISKPDLSGDDPLHKSTRIGPNLPICCPLHHQTTRMISSRREHRQFPDANQWNTFCSIRCTHKLDCGHECQLPCHFPSQDNHNEKCQVQLKRPCDKHKETPLYCYEVSRNKKESLIDALTRWKCQCKNKYEMPCGHRMTLECYVAQEIMSGTREIPNCQEIVDDYIHSKCGHHIVNPKCYEKKKYIDNPPYCDIEVSIRRKCGHERKMSCYKTYLGENVIEDKPCEIMDNFKRPRCKHEISLRCCDYQKLPKLLQFDEVDINEKMVSIEEGKHYGPSESNTLPKIGICCVPVLFKKSCGHKMRIKCDKAFEYAKSGSPECDDPILVDCILCEKSIQIPCKYFDMYQDLCSLGLFEDIISRGGICIADEQKFPSEIEDSPIWELLAKAKCKTKIQLKRSCYFGHNVELSCFDVLNMFVKRTKLPPTCESLVPKRLNCGHTVDVKCNLKDRPVLCKRPIFEEFKYPNCEHTCKPENCGKLQILKNDPNVKCPYEVNFSLFRCHHPSIAKCIDYQNFTRPSRDLCLPPDSNIVLASKIYCEPCINVPICNSRVTYQYECGHQINEIPCSNAFNWSKNPSEAPKCVQPMPWTSPLCQHELLMPCHVINTLDEWEPWSNQRFPEYETITGSEQLQRQLVLIYPPPKPQNLQILSNTKMKCNASISIYFKNSCQHTRTLSCHEVFHKSSYDLQCIEKEEITCESCSYKRIISCVDLRKLTKGEIRMQCTNKIPKVCNRCQINEVIVPCNQLDVRCDKDVETILQCGHQSKWKCGVDQDPRLFYNANKNISLYCSICAIEQWEKNNELELNGQILLDECNKKLNQTLNIGESFKVINRIELIDPHNDDNIQAYERSRHIIINKIQEAIRSKQSEIIFPTETNSLNDYISKNYEIVFLPIPLENNPDLNKLKQRFDSKKTMYGKGLPISKLTKETTEKSVYDTNGQLKICICLAFQCNILTDKDPFKVGNGSEEQDKRANKSRLQFQNQGYDCVEVKGSNRNEVVYWHENAVIPLYQITLQLQRSCCICGEFYIKGCLCSNNHLVCFECMNDYLDSSKQPDSINTYVNRDGELKCPQCPQYYKIFNLAATDCSPEILQELQKLQLDRQIQANANLVRRECEEKMENELKKIREMDEITREVQFKKLKIIDDILTPRCPRCKQAFIDFNGCFALTCGNNHCQCGFCAWCFQDCGPDAHAHVSNCQYSATRGNVFGDLNSLKRVWNIIRKEKINVLLQNCSPQIRLKVLESLKKEFKDIGLVM